MNLTWFTVVVGFTPKMPISLIIIYYCLYFVLMVLVGTEHYRVNSGSGSALLFVSALRSLLVMLRDRGKFECGTIDISTSLTLQVLGAIVDETLPLNECTTALLEDALQILTAKVTEPKTPALFTGVHRLVLKS